MKKRLLTCLTIALMCLSLFAVNAGAKTLLNYTRLYRGPRSLGMGGAFTAVKGDVDTLFYNPAGLEDMSFLLDLISVSAETDEDFINVAEDIIDAMDLATDTERLSAITDIINANLGKAFHGQVTVLPAILYQNFGLAILAKGEADIRLHNALSSQGTVEVDGGVEVGPVAGFSFALPVDGLRMGIGGKWLQRMWVERNFTAQELASDNFDFSDFDTTNSDFSFDLGLMYDLPFWDSLSPVVGLAALDITDLDFKEGGEIPSRINIGLSISPGIDLFSHFIVALDFEDVTQEYPEDGSFWKRFHAGMEAGVLKDHLCLRAGINQGYPTVGATIDLWIIRLNYAYYSEEMGAYSGQDENSRHILQFVLGF